ncbi:MAG TPA: C1 family peptidase [Cyclobacteriaceae bacterium]|nr:C1 family peptidase [Cyclobacteriaceae bacterium]
MSKQKNEEMLSLDDVLEEQNIMARFKIGDGDFLKRAHAEQPESTSAEVIESIFSEQKGMGWLRDMPDFRDYNINTELDDVSKNRISKGVKRSVKKMADELNVLKAPATLPASVNLVAWFSPVEDQSSLGSCTANAGVGIVEYFERRAFGHHLDASRLFLYKATRNLLNWTGDTGAYLRTTMEALTVFGVCPEKYWPYRINTYDTEPTAFCYSFAQNYQAISYFRHDLPGMTQTDLLNRIKAWIAAGVPAMFGFTCYSSLNQANVNGKIPYPSPGETVIGGHAVVAAGYDDQLLITNRNNNKTTKGAFLIRNSWGTNWGNNGYGWLPYEYVLKSQAVDWWSLLKAEWVDTGKFGL